MPQLEARAIAALEAVADGMARSGWGLEQRLSAWTRMEKTHWEIRGRSIRPLVQSTGQRNRARKRRRKEKEAAAAVERAEAVIRARRGEQGEGEDESKGEVMGSEG